MQYVEPIAIKEQTSVDESMSYDQKEVKVKESNASMSLEDANVAIKLPLERGSPPSFKDEVIIW